MVKLGSRGGITLNSSTAFKGGERTSGGTTTSFNPSEVLVEQGTTIQRDTAQIQQQQIKLEGDFNLQEVRITKSISGDNFEPIFSKGLNDQRPEIISLLNFLPAYIKDENNFSSAGKFLNIQFDLNKFKTNKVLGLIEKLKENALSRQIVEELEKKSQNEINLLNREISFLKSAFFNIEQVRQAFQIKKNEKKIQQEMARIRKTDVRNVKTLRELFVDDLGFSDQGYSQFLNTKVLMTLLSDLKTAITLFSPVLLFRPIIERGNDVNSINITKINLGTNTLLLNDFSNIPFGTSNFNDWVDLFSDRLPASSFDKMLFILSLLFREFSISAGLNRSSILSLLQERFPNAPKDIKIFNVIFGSVGNTIFSPVFGENSLANFLRLEDENENIILSFEDKFVENEEVLYIPGTNRFVDPVLKNPEGLSILHLNQFKNNFDRVVSFMNTVIENSILLENVQDTNLRNSIKSSNLFQKFLESLDEMVSNSLIRRVPVGLKRKFTKIAGLFNQAKNNKEIKKILFKIFFAEGLRRSQGGNPTQQTSNFYTRIVSSGLTKRDFAKFIFDEFSTEEEQEDVDIDTAISRLINELMLKLQEIFNISGPNSPSSDADLFINIVDLSLFSRDFFSESDTIFRKMNNFLDYLDINARNISVLDNPEALFSDVEQDIPDAETFPSGFTVGGRDVLDTPDVRARNRIETYTKNGLTKANSVSLIYIAWLVFEMYMAFFNDYFTISLARSPTGNKSILINRFETSKIVTSYNAIRSHLGLSLLSSKFVNEESFNLNLEKLNITKSKLQKEISLIKDMSSVFKAINKRLKTATLNLNDFLRDNRENKKRFDEILSQVDGREKFATLSEGQINVATSIFENFKIARNNPESPFIDDSFVPNTIKNSLFSLLREPEFRTESGFNLRLISIGLPSGFMDSLKSRFDTFLVGARPSSFREEEARETDVVRIKIYKQDLQFEDIIFKPKSFIFEMSRFLFLDSFNEILDNNIGFDGVVARTTTRNLALSNNKILIEKVEDILGKPQYSFLSFTERRGMVRNHIMSFLLNFYIKFLTSMNLSEKEFLMSNEVLSQTLDNEILEVFKELLISHVSNIAKKTITFDDLKRQNLNLKTLIEEIENNKIVKSTLKNIETKFDDLTKSANIQISEDLKNFLNIFSYRSFIFGAGSSRQKITSPKLFERIFTIPVDPDDFEIDLEKTLSTNSGRQMWEQDFVSENVIQFEENGKTKFKLKPRNEQENDSEMVKFFTTIEQLPTTIREDAITPTKIESPTRLQLDSRSEKQKELIKEIKDETVIEADDGGTTTFNPDAVNLNLDGGTSNNSNNTSHGSDSENNTKTLDFSNI